MAMDAKSVCVGFDHVYGSHIRRNVVAHADGYESALGITDWSLRRRGVIAVESQII